MTYTLSGRNRMINEVNNNTPVTNQQKL